MDTEREYELDFEVACILEQFMNEKPKTFWKKVLHFLGFEV